jgi:hypothetical protein
MNGKEKTMRYIRLLVLPVLIVITLVVTYRQSPSQSTQTRAKSVPSGQLQQVKPRKILVKELPKDLEGITLKNGVFKLKPGYKFVPQPDGSVVVALQAGPHSLGGRFMCVCESSGATSGVCAVLTDKSTLTCGKLKDNPCSGECKLTVLTTGARTALAIF